MARGAADNDVVTAPGPDFVAAGAADQQVQALAAVKLVISSATLEQLQGTLVELLAAIRDR